MVLDLRQSLPGILIVDEADSNPNAAKTACATDAVEVGLKIGSTIVQLGDILDPCQWGETIDQPKIEGKHLRS